jgi:N-acetylglucosaminyl-diphospho-decaprenol L-rhamnosyltransferase
MPQLECETFAGCPPACGPAANHSGVGRVVIDVSVCIANWNCRDLLRGCLESLTEDAQGVRLEIIVADNDSSDGAVEMVVEQFPGVRLIRNSENRGFARASNQAAQCARGRYLFFLNNDTFVPPGTIRQLVDYLEKHPEVGMVAPRLRDGQGNVQVSCRPRPTVATLLHRTSLLRWTGLLRSGYWEYRRGDFDAEATRAVDVLMGAAVLVARDRFLAWGGWDEDFTFGGEDMELSYRINRHARVVFYPRAEITHFGRASTRQHVRFASLQITIGLVKYLRKTGASRLSLWIYKAVQTLDAPVSVLLKAGEYVLRRSRGRQRKAEQSLRVLRAQWHFLVRGLVAFWRA